MLLMAAAAVLVTLAGLACAGAADDDPAQGRLARKVGDEECVYDARVTLNPDGVLREVRTVGSAAEGKIEPGMVVEGADAVFPNGIGVPIPVYLDGAGVLRLDYASCGPADD
jgi:hypothetical protein